MTSDIVVARIYSEENEPLIFNKYHIFLNYDFTQETKCFLPKVINFWRSNPDHISSDHRVHIFFNRENESIKNGKFREFVENCNQVMIRWVVIHISKRNPELKALVEDALKGIPYQLFFEKPSHVTAFSYPLISHPYFYVTYGWVGPYDSSGAMLYGHPFGKEYLQRLEERHNENQKS